MAQITVKNPKFLDRGDGLPDNWSIGGLSSWSCDDLNPQSSGIGGGYQGAGDNTLFQNSVFTDYASAVSHRIKVVVGGVITPCSVAVRFGTANIGTITAAGTYYFTGVATANATLIFDIQQGFINLEYVMDATEIDIVSMTGADATWIEPVYNPIWFEVSSTRTAQPNFKYVFDVFTGVTASGNPLTRVKLLPRPNANPMETPKCLFSPARILESYLGYDARIQNIVEPTNSIRHFTPYTILFGDEFGDLSTGTTIYSGLTRFSGYTWNGVNQYEQIPGFDFTDFLIPGGRYLTNQPSEVYIKNSTDRGTLSFMQINSAATKTKLIVYQNSGGTKSYFMEHTGITPNNIVHVPSGIWNLNNLPNSADTVNLSTDYKYTLECWNGNSISNVKTYLIDTKCGKYSTVRLQFLNRLGGFDYMNMNLVSKKTLTVKKDTYRKVLGYNYQLGDRGSTVLDIDGGYSYKVQSDWISDEESIWLQELISSNEVYVINSDGTATPIVLDENSYEIKNSLNDKLFNISINYTLASKLNSQRG